MTTLICLGDDVLPGCGKVLTEDELHYYENRCEGCERAWMEAVEAWRRGGDNAAMDALFGEPRSIQ